MLTFNSSFYLSQNTDVAAAVSDGQIDSAYSHYILHGASEGRDPNAFFDTSFYLATNADVQSAGLNALEHYNQFGEAEGRAPNSIFDPTYYAAQNPDVVASGLGLFEHFVAFGATEGRVPSATLATHLSSGFNEAAYLAANADVASAVANGQLASGQAHWMLYGHLEGRTGAQNLSGDPLSTPSSVPGQAFSGYVIDGKVSGATVGIDLNGDGVIGPNEPTVTTDALGEFIFPDGTPVGPIIATGGTDISTGLPFDGKMEAPAGSTVVNPLTTIIKKIADANTDPSKSEVEKVADAQTQLKSLLGLTDVTADITQIDYVTESTEGDSSGSEDAVSDADGARLYAASVQLLNIVDQGAAAITGADGNVKAEDASSAMFASLAEKLSAIPQGQTVNLGATAGSDSDADDLLINAIKGAAANTLSGEAASKVDQIADSAAAIAAAANKEIADRVGALGTDAVGSAVETALIEIVKTQKVVQGSAADDIKAAAASDNPDAAAQNVSNSIAASDGSGFVSDDLIDQQEVGDIDGDGTVDELPTPPTAPTPPTTTPTPPTPPTINEITGTDQDDTLTGTDGRDNINALNGNDVINSGAGRDNIFAGEGDDQITVDAAGGSKHITPGAGNDQIIRTEGATSLLRLSYDQENGGNGIIFRLVTATKALVQDTYGDTDTITYNGPTNIEFNNDLKVTGTDFDDKFFGHSGGILDSSFKDDDFYAGFEAQPQGGNDQIFGNLLEFDTINYSEENDGVTRTVGINVTWGNGGGTIDDGLGGNDTFDQNIDQIVGSQLADTFESTGSYSRFRGLDGADRFDGTDGTNDTVDYRGDDDWGGTGAIQVNLAAGTAIDGFGNTDTLIGIERVRGSDIDGVSDTLLGSGDDNQIRGYRGDDRIEGLGGNDDLRGGHGDDTIIGGTGDDRLRGDEGNDILVAGTGNDWLRGGAGDDDITATSGFNHVIGGAGDDQITGSSSGGSVVMMNYSDEEGGQGITVTYTSELDATVIDTYGDTDTLYDVFQFQTTNGDDVIGDTGITADPNTPRTFWFDMAGGGDDTIDIGWAYVNLSYSQYWYENLGTPTQGINADFSLLDAQGFATITDTYGGIDKVKYWGFGDTGGVSGIRGSELDDSLIGGSGDDDFAGNDGADTIDGGAGWDHVNYGSFEYSNENGAFSGVTVNLTTGTATDAFGKTDTLTNIESVQGTSGDDDLTGDSNNNYLSGDSGDDTFNGGAGTDDLWGGEGNDTFTTGDGQDRINYFGSMEYGEDTVLDFMDGEDKIVFGGISQEIANGFVMTAENDGSDTLIDFGSANGVDLGQVTLVGIAAVDLAITQVGDTVEIA